MAKNYRLSEIDINLLAEGSIYYDGPDKKEKLKINEKDEHNILILPLTDEVFIPYMNIGTIIHDQNLINTSKKAYQGKEPVFIFFASEKLPENLSELKSVDYLFRRGAVGYINEIKENGDGSVFLSATIGPRAVLINITRRSPYLRGDVVYLLADKINLNDIEKEKEANLNRLYEEIAILLSEEDRKQLYELLDRIGKDQVRRLYFMIQNSPLHPKERYKLLEAHSLQEQRDLFMEMLMTHKDELVVRADIHNKTMSEIGHRQREDYLRTQMQQIKNELGDSDETELEELKQRALTKEWTNETELKFEKELRKLQRLYPNSPDYAVQYAYLDTFLEMPWGHCDNSEFTLDKVESTLNKDHYGLEKVKDRIIEQMAVLKLRKDTRAPIMCLYGPPGTGKTSLGKSIAEATGRKYVRVALGGLHDEAEIRGHRRTYLGSMPGRIISALQKCGTSDPVMVLDEIDKIGADYKGDPSQALLEVLDPEQNCKFHDNYIDHDYDLSKVLFIATANSLSTISAPLLDRMELIEIGGYSEQEKIEIAKRHLIPKNLKEHGFNDNEILFDEASISQIIANYTRESGVRRLEKKINDIFRKLARKKVSGNQLPVEIKKDMVIDFLGKPEIFNDEYENNDIPGVVTGLAWTQAGGDILFIESSKSPGKDCKLVLTGNLGEVMKESAVIALQYIKSNHKEIGIPEEAFEVGTVHVHVPEGAVPKDGPSAGITIVTSLASTFTGKRVRSHIAMTGEITLRGKVLPVGGIKEKILAAKRAGIKTILLCEKNRKDIEEIKAEYLKGIKFHYVTNISEVLDFALLSE